MINLDLDILRTFVTIVDRGSFSHAASLHGLTQSAVSMQIRRLEDQLGCKLFRREGRTMVLDDAGHQFINYARQLLATNDRALADMRLYRPLSGSVRFGSTLDFSDSFLPRILRRFAHDHPLVRVETKVERNALLVRAVEESRLDIAVALGHGAHRTAHIIARLPTRWLGSRAFKFAPDQAVPLVAVERPCQFFTRATEALDRAGRRWDLIFTGPNLPSLIPALRAGLGITLRTTYDLPPDLTVLGTTPPLPEAKPVEVALHVRPGKLDAPVQRMFDLLKEELSVI